MVLEPLPARYAAPHMRARIDLIASSYRRLTGRDLVAPTADMAAALWAAPRVIVAHGTEPDPIFFFGNLTALARFATTLDAFTAMPSRLSAEPLQRAARQALLDRVARDGFIDDYAGVRISASGRRFRIEQAVVWNLAGTDGAVHGQAATFERWTELEG